MPPKFLADENGFREFSWESSGQHTRLFERCPGERNWFLWEPGCARSWRALPPQSAEPCRARSTAARTHTQRHPLRGFRNGSGSGKRSGKKIGRNLICFFLGFVFRLVKCCIFKHFVMKCTYFTLARQHHQHRFQHPQRAIKHFFGVPKHGSQA